MTDLTLTVERSIKAAQKDVFNAWLDPEMLKKFMTPGPNMTVPKAATEAREGGRFDIVMRAGDDDLPHGGVYKTIDPHSRIVFTWESPFSVDGSTVTLDFVPEGDGTLVRLTQVRFVDEQSRDNHQGGWTGILAALAEAV